MHIKMARVTLRNRYKICKFHMDRKGEKRSERRKANSVILKKGKRKKNKIKIKKERFYFW